MLVFVLKLDDEFRNARCECCSKTKATHGCVPTKRLKWFQKHTSFTNEQAALFLLKENELGVMAIGELLCEKCLKEKITPVRIEK